jgi:glycosyltransferase involved in cell wall biosynthesis
MRILALTSGAANMYCGSCLRDNALAAELIAQGHEVTLVPTYTPTLTDEPNVSQERVFFGGISVYLEQYVPLFRHTPRWLDRLWDTNWALKLAARRSIAVAPQQLGALTVSMLKGEEGFQRKELLKLLDWLRQLPAPDIVALPYSLLISLARPIKETLGRPVVCTLQGEELFLSGLPEPYQRQALALIRANIEHVDGFIMVSHYGAEFMPGYLAIPQDKVHVVPLGINLRGYEPRPRAESKEFVIGYFARVAPEKGLHLLCEAYRRLRARGDCPALRLEVAGYLAPEHKAYLSGLERQMREWGLGQEFHYRGVLDREEKIRFLQGLDALSVPATYDEPKGIFLLEAMANGVPVVQPRRGSFTEIINQTGGGILVKPDDIESLAEGLLSLAKNPRLARQLGQRGSEGVRQHYHVTLMARRALDVYRRLIASAAEPVPQAALAERY